MRSDFYLVCPIGFENILLQELNLKWPLHFPSTDFDLIEVAKGGLEINTLSSHGLALNHILKTCTKILLRIKKQKCRDLPKMYNIFKKIKWKDLINQEQVQISVSASKSRLIHTDRIHEAAISGINDYFMANRISQKIKDEHSKARPPEIFIRLFEDEMQISLNTSGELLSIREDNQFKGHAPIRSTFASSLLLYLLGVQRDYIGYNLIDPMCGSGTFLKEALNFMQLNKREFAYSSFNKNLIGIEISLEDKSPIWKFKTIIGHDIDPSVISELSNPTISYSVQDIFKTTSHLKNDKNIVITNPPYGKRVKISADKFLYFEDIIKSVKKHYSPHHFGMIIPHEFSKTIKREHSITFNQNGIKVSFLSVNV